MKINSDERVEIWNLIEHRLGLHKHLDFATIIKGIEQLPDDTIIIKTIFSSVYIQHKCPICKEYQKTILKCSETLTALMRVGCNPMFQFICIECDEKIKHFIPKITGCNAEMYMMGVKMECDNCYYNANDNCKKCNTCYASCNWQPNFQSRKGINHE